MITAKNKHFSFKFKPVEQTYKILTNIFSSEYTWLFLIILSSFLTNIVYVFYLTNYKDYLYSDMGMYWNRANDSYKGDIFSVVQWSGWATFYQFYLTLIFKILNFLHLFDRRLEIVLILNIIYSTISVLFIYLISKQVIRNKFFSLLATFFYAFAYTRIHLNAFLLTENLAVPILIASVYLLLTYNKDSLIIFLTGMFFALSVAMRPALGLIALPFFLYIVFSNSNSLKSILKSTKFAAGFFLIILIVLVENNYISHGQLKNLSGHGGVNFFMYQCKHSSIKSVSKGYQLYMSPPFCYYNPKYKPIETDHLIHDDAYFYKRGIECLKNNPHFLIEHTLNLRELLFGPPWGKALKGPELLLSHLSNYLIFFMTLSLVLVYQVLKDRKTESKKILVLLSLPLCIAFMSYFFPPEHRYLFPAHFVIYTTFFTIPSHIKDYNKQATAYFKTLIIVYLAYFFFFSHPSSEQTISMFFALLIFLALFKLSPNKVTSTKI